MSEETLRTVTVERIGFARCRATNVEGVSIEIGDGAFSAVELLLAAMASCAAADVDSITNKLAEPVSFSVTAKGNKIRDEHGNRMVNLALDFTVTFPTTRKVMPPERFCRGRWNNRVIACAW
ncbi:MAG: hypothetical protein ABR609_12795 [Acidimicrobiia bacterium]